MNIARSFARFEKLVTDNSPVILTAVGVVGVVATGVLAAKGAFKASEIVLEETERDNIENGLVDIGIWEPLDRKETVKLTWLCYAPAVGVGVLSITAIVLANRISTRRAAALAAAYMATEKAHDEYKDKMREVFGVNKEEKAVNDLTQADVDRNPPRADGIIHTGFGDVLFRDGWSGRYFYSSMEAVKKAENSVNKTIHANDYVSLTQYYTALNISSTTASDDFGWTSYTKWLEVDYNTTTTEDGRVACHVLKYAVVPMRDFR